MEPELPPRSYSPSVFQTVGLGEPPSGVNIPSDSMLNILRDHHSQRVPKQVMRTEAARQQPSEPLSVPLEAKEEERYEPEVQPQQYSHPTVRRKPSRQRSRQMDSSDVETDGEFGFRTRQEEPVQTFRQFSQQRQRSDLRNSGISRRYRNEE